MPGSDIMKAAMQNYLDRFNAGDLEGILALYADTASVEDPVGSPVHQGMPALRKFYSDALKSKARLELLAPIRGSLGTAAAMAFDVKLNLPSGPATVRVIDVMSFDKVGKIVSLRAYWGPDDFVPG